MARLHHNGLMTSSRTRVSGLGLGARAESEEVDRDCTAGARLGRRRVGLISAVTVTVTVAAGTGGQKVTCQRR